MNKTLSVLRKLFFIFLAVSAVIALVLLYKNEILDAIDEIKEKIESLKHRFLHSREYEDYENEII